MSRKVLIAAAKRELGGASRLLVVLAVAAAVLLLPNVSFAQGLLPSTFLSPPPVPASMTVGIASTGRLQARIEARVPLSIKCGPFSYPPYVYVTLNLSQVDKGVVNGVYGSIAQPVICDNATHSVTAAFVLNNGATPFHPGPAVVGANVQACGTDLFYSYVCVQQNMSRQITLN